MDTTTDEPIDGYDPIPIGAVIQLTNLPAGLSIRANINVASESLQFGLNENPDFSRENVEPYALFGDSSGDFAPGTLNPGTYEISATSYSQDNVSGQEVELGASTLH